MITINQLSAETRRACAVVVAKELRILNPDEATLAEIQRIGEIGAVYHAAINMAVMGKQMADK